jgi:hypothetical protein
VAVEWHQLVHSKRVVYMCAVHWMPERDLKNAFFVPPHKVAHFHDEVRVSNSQTPRSAHGRKKNKCAEMKNKKKFTCKDDRFMFGFYVTCVFGAMKSLPFAVSFCMRRTLVSAGADYSLCKQIPSRL